MNARGIIAAILAGAAALAPAAFASSPAALLADAFATSSAALLTAAPASADDGTGAALPHPGGAPVQPGIAPFLAHYQADWKSTPVGTSDLELRQDAEPGRYLYTWTITAHGIFRLVYRNDLVQKSWFSINAEHVRPSRYSAVDGSATANLEFDWDSGRARGKTEKKSVDLKLSEGTQDVMSIQVEVMLGLKNGNLPKTFHIVDRDEVKEFTYAREGTAKIKTALGEMETVIVSSQRPGNSRVLKMWFAPALGYVPVQAERTRDGKLEFAMRIKSLKR